MICSVYPCICCPHSGLYLLIVRLSEHLKLLRRQEQSGLKEEGGRCADSRQGHVIRHITFLLEKHYAQLGERQKFVENFPKVITVERDFNSSFHNFNCFKD